MPVLSTTSISSYILEVWDTLVLRMPPWRAYRGSRTPAGLTLARIGVGSRSSRRKTRILLPAIRVSIAATTFVTFLSGAFKGVSGLVITITVSTVFVVVIITFGLSEIITVPRFNIKTVVIISVFGVITRFSGFACIVSGSVKIP